jgi:hypothetical protein
MKKSSFMGIAAALAAMLGQAHATSFTISSNSTTAQTLGSSSGQTGTVNAGKSLTVSGTTVAVTITGNNATLTNNGTISQTGSGRAVRDNTGVTGLVVTNNAGALMQTADADVIQMNKTPASVTLNNYGTMTSLNASKGGAQAVDFNAILSGSNIINNYSTGIMQAQDADAVRPGVGGQVNNSGQILATHTTDTSDDGIDAQNNSGVSVTNTSTGSIEGARHGITGGAVDNTVTFTMGITNNSGGTIKGNNGSGVNIDGFNNKETVTISNDGTITGNGVTGDGDGVDVDGVVNITNTGTIKSINSFSATLPAQSEGVTVGGGTITNSGTIEGDVAAGNTNAVGRGITLAGIDTTGTAEPIYANSVVTNNNGGLIKGQTDSAIAVDGAASGFTVTVTNNAGATIEGGGATAAAIRTGADNDTINNSGTIQADASGKAIDMGAGNNTLNISGGSASIVGDVNGGSGGTNSATIDPGAGHSFTFSNSFSNFASVLVKSGTVTLSGVSTYSGTTEVDGGILVLDGANRLASTSFLDLNGGTIQFADINAAEGQTFGGLTVANISEIDLNHTTSLSIGTLVSYTTGMGLAIVNYDPALSAYAIRFPGDLTHDSAFQALLSQTTINGQSAKAAFDGTYTNVALTPVPEPSTVYAGFALIGLMAARQVRAFYRREA